MQPYYEDDLVTIYNGDCREILTSESVSRAEDGRGRRFLDGATLVTDPPYGMSYASHKPDSAWRGSKIANDDSTAVRDFVLDWWRGSPALVFGTWKQPRPANVRTILIWEKPAGMGDLGLPWHPNYEEIYVIGNGFSGTPRSTSVLRGYSVTTRSHARSWSDTVRVHPNEKPVGLLIDLIRKCPAGGILDPFCGSGTTLRAAKDLGRRAIGIEIEEKYCDIAAQRCAQEALALDAA